MYGGKIAGGERIVSLENCARFRTKEAGDGARLEEKFAPISVGGRYQYRTGMILQAQTPSGDTIGRLAIVNSQ